MNQLNSLIIEGNAVRDAELSEPKAGFMVCRFPVAVNHFRKNSNDEWNSEVSYFDVETYGKAAEFNSKKIEKGRGVRIVGRLKQSRWEDEDGKSHQKVYIVAEHIEYKPKFNSAVPASEDIKNNGSQSEPEVEEMAATEAEMTSDVEF